MVEVKGVLSLVFTVFLFAVVLASPSAVFNSPLGGEYFTSEILLNYSIFFGKFRRYSFF